MQLRPQVPDQGEEFRLIDAACWPYLGQAAFPSSTVIPTSPLSPKAIAVSYSGSLSIRTTWSLNRRGGIGAPNHVDFGPLINKSFDDAEAQASASSGHDHDLILGAHFVRSISV